VAFASVKNLILNQPKIKCRARRCLKPVGFGLQLREGAEFGKGPITSFTRDGFIVGGEEIDAPGAKQKPIPATTVYPGEGLDRSFAADAAYFIDEAIISQER
jgi:hypothetical protein